ncbi:MAG: hypothetical protein WC623_24625 [Pedobacter sp.]|uniref:hypothetical protein n=1 Tax=Pedobacter sp. TaxID=1411316 RepID=UPI00356697A2
MKTINYLIFFVAYMTITVSILAEDTITDIFEQSTVGMFVGFRDNQILFIPSNKIDTSFYLFSIVDKLELSDGQILTRSDLIDKSENWKKQTELYSDKSFTYPQNNTVINEPKHPFVKFKEYYRDNTYPNIFYFKMIFGEISKKDYVIDILTYWCNKVAYEYGYNYYSIEDLQIVNEIFIQYHVFTVQFYKSEIVSPCEDPIFQTIKEKKFEDLSEREFEYYKIKSKECDDYNNRLVLKQGQVKQKQQSKERNEILWLLILVIWIPYYISTLSL